MSRADLRSSSALARTHEAFVGQKFEPSDLRGLIDADWTLGAAIDRKRTNTATFADRIAWASLMRAPSQLYTGL